MISPMRKMIQCLLIISLLSSFIRFIRSDPPYTNCTSTANFTSQSPFSENLQNLLSTLVSTASNSHFSNVSVGEGHDTVYGNFLCYNTVGNVKCQAFVKKAVVDIKGRCSMSIEAIVWEEDCQLRYSNRRFFGVMDYTTYRPSLYNENNYSEPETFRVVVKNLLNNLSRSAALSPSNKNYSLYDQRKVGNDILYALVQCTGDILPPDCSKCLHNAISDIQSCCYSYRGARVLSRSCYLRYELYPIIPQTASGVPIPPEGEPSSRVPTPREGEPSNFSHSVIMTIAALVVAVALLSSWVYYRVWGHEKHKENLEATSQGASRHYVVTPDLFSQEMVQRDEMKATDLPLISISTILEVTNHFSDSNILGKGGYGPVYKGVLPEGKEVAIKRLSIVSEQGSAEFMNEILLIMRLQHKNLVRLLGCCIEEGEKILVYEYMPNNSLDTYIFDPKRRLQLDWRRRHNIITGIARGLLYLHQDSRLRIIHRDLKAGNILLDENMNPRISDFGMARIFGGNVSQANTNIIVGTYGYMAPEYAMEGLYSIKSDVFSFGVLLTEIVTGKKNAGFHLSQHAPSLLSYAWKLWNAGTVLELMDPVLSESCITMEFLRCVHIGLLCVQEDPNDRPKMSEVVVMLENKYVPLCQPLRPAYSVGRVAVGSDLHSSSSINGLTLSSVSPR